MKRLVQRLLVFLIPFVMLVTLFFIFEPYDYFACKNDEWYMSRSISSMRELLLKKPSHIILGDSRMANLNTAYIEELSGTKYTNMAYGGATLSESIDQFWFATDHTVLKKVVIGFDYYTLNNKLSNTDRMPDIMAKSMNPLLFLADFGYWIDSMQNAKNKAFTLFANVTGNESLRPLLDDPSSLNQKDPPNSNTLVDGYREDLYNYAKIIFSNMVGEGGYGIDFAFNNPDSYLQRLLDIAFYCNEHSIELVFVIMPCNRAIWDLVIFPNGIGIAIEIYKNMLKAVATVYDGEFYNDFAKDDNLFLDGHHLVLQEKMRLARILFTGEQSEYWLMTTPESYRDGRFQLTEQMQIVDGNF